MPKLRAAFAEGELDWTKCRLAARAATAETEDEWIAKARSMTNRGLERAVAEAKGERPLLRVTLELSPADLADLEEAVKALREERGEAVPLGSAVAELCRRAMGPPAERPGHQIVIHECDKCGAAARDSRTGPIEVPKAELDAAKADAEVLDLREGGKGKRRTSITPAERRAVIARDHGRCVLCGTRAWLHLHHVERREGDTRVLALLCSSCHKGLLHAGHVTMTGRAPDFEVRRRASTRLSVG